MKVALSTISTFDFNKDQNLEKMKEVIENVDDATHLILFGEATLNGFNGLS